MTMPLPLITAYFLSIIANLTLGLITIFTKKKTVKHLSFGLFCIAQAFWALSLYIGYHYTLTETNLLISEPAFRAAYGFGALMMPAIITFFLTFPEEKSPINITTKISIFPLGIAVALLATFTPLIHTSSIVENNTYIGDNFGPLYPAYMGIIIYHFFLGLYFSLKKFLLAEGLNRAKLRIATTSAWIFLISTFTINVILPLFKVYVLPFQAVMLSFIFVLPTLYAILKYRFFSFNYLVINTLNFVAKIILFLLVFISCSNHLSAPFSATIAFSLTTIAFHYIPKIPNKRFAAFVHEIRRLSFDLQNTFSPSWVSQKLEKSLSLVLNLPKPKLFLVLDEVVTDEIPTYIINEKIHRLAREEPLLLIQEQENPLFQELRADLIMPLFLSQGSNQPIAFFCLGNGDNDHFFVKEELRELLKLKSSLELFIGNFLIRKNLHEESDLLGSIIEKHTSNLTDFVALTAHELRTPLSIALFQLEDTMHSNAKNEKLLADMRVMEKSLESLQFLTEKLFEIQKFDLQQNKPDKRPTDLCHLIGKIYQNYQSLAEKDQKKLSLHVHSPCPLPINIDRAQIQQTINNLLSNAFRFASEIEIILEKTKHAAIIKIKDNGPGIPDQDKERVFHKFQTTSTSLTSGIGLGLYICKKIILLHNGQIYITNNRPHGCIFHIELPLN